jgi:nucleoside-triphosphatase THEP1
VGGLVSPAVFAGENKTGIDLLDLRSGSQKRLAVHRGESGNGQNTIDWHFDEEVLYWGNTVLEQLKTCQFFILDELGPLELQRGVGLTNGLELVTARRYRLACVVVRPSLLEIAQALWPWGEVFYVRSGHPKEDPA